MGPRWIYSSLFPLDIMVIKLKEIKVEFFVFDIAHQFFSFYFVSVTYENTETQRHKDLFHLA